MGKTAATYGSGLTFEEVGRHFFTHIESYKLLAFFTFGTGR